MIDPHGRVIDYLRIAITDRCNLRCRYCMPEAGVAMQDHAGLLSYEELLRVAGAAVAMGVRKIRLTGGEPLVRRGLVEFIRQLAQLPARPEITLTTNGLLLSDLAAPLKAAGLDRVNVSLDTLRPERFRAITRRDGLDRVFAGLDAAAAVGLRPLKINVVPIQNVNADEIADFGRLALERDCDIRFIEYMPVSPDVDYPAAWRYPAEAILRDLQALGPLAPYSRSGGPSGPARLYRYAQGRGRVGIIPAVSNHFCGECNRLRLTPDGQLKSCLFSRDEIDLRAILRAGADEAAIIQRLREAIAAKPERHTIGSDGFQPCGRSMSTIGG